MSGVWAISVVKNEADIIESTIRHLAAEGVEGFLIADNMSADNTLDILKHLGLYFRVVCLRDTEFAHYQARKMSALARIAGEDYRASWIVPFDADEIWYSREGTLADTCRKSIYSVLGATRWEHVVRPSDVAGISPVLSTIHRRVAPTPLVKVAFRYMHNAVLGEGSHGVSIGAPKMGELFIREFQYRSLEHLKRKVRNGKAVLEAAPELPLSIGTHWRRLGAMSDEELAEEWLRMTAPDGLVLDPAPVKGLR